VADGSLAAAAQTHGPLRFCSWILDAQERAGLRSPEDLRFVSAAAAAGLVLASIFFLSKVSLSQRAGASQVPEQAAETGRN
jgi:hypothetical protein